MEYTIPEQHIIFSEKIPCTKENLKQIEKKNGIYIFYEGEEIVYIGSSKNVWDRTYNHHYKGNTSYFHDVLVLDGKDNTYFDKLYISYAIFDYGRAELEEQLIKQYSPKYNNYKRTSRKS